MVPEPTPADAPDDGALDVSIVMPCLDEERTVGACVRQAWEALQAAGLRGEVIVADNGSRDQSRRLALAAGARVVDVARRGYGAAILGGVAAARGELVVVGDADGSYNFLDAPRFVAQLRDGYDLVIGNRFRGGIAPGAMPMLHRYLGNPVLTTIGRLLYRAPCGDFHCGLRGFRRDSIAHLRLNTPGMEFASEMIVKASLQRLRVGELPTTLSPDGRDRQPHLRSWRDGWRHLRFMLLLCPRWLFLYPGVILIVVGVLALLWLLPGPRAVSGLTLDVHTLLFAATAVVLGAQSVLFAVLGGHLAERLGWTASPRPARHRWRGSPEWALLLGGGLISGGLAAAVGAVWWWSCRAFGTLPVQDTLRVVVPAVMLLMLGGQVFLSGLFHGIIDLIDERSP